MKRRFVASLLIVPALAVPLVGCAHQMSDQDVSDVREIACSLQNSYAQSASFAIGELNPGKFWSIGPKVAEFSETLAISGRMGAVDAAYANFAEMFAGEHDATRGVTEEDVDTFNGHIASIAAACEGNPGHEEPLRVEYPTDLEDRGYLQRLEP